MPASVIFIDQPHPHLPARLQSAGYTVLERTGTALPDLWAELAQAEGIVLRSRFTIDQAFLERCPNLRFIARMGIGLEHVDVAYAEQRGIAVLNSPEGSRDTVAEQAVG